MPTIKRKLRALENARAELKLQCLHNVLYDCVDIPNCGVNRVFDRVLTETKNVAEACVKAGLVPADRLEDFERERKFVNRRIYHANTEKEFDDPFFGAPDEGDSLFWPYQAIRQNGYSHDQAMLALGIATPLQTANAEHMPRVPKSAMVWTPPKEIDGYPNPRDLVEDDPIDEPEPRVLVKEQSRDERVKFYIDQLGKIGKAIITAARVGTNFKDMKMKALHRAKYHARSLRDLATETRAFANKEHDLFEVAWETVSADWQSFRCAAKRGPAVTKFYPKAATA
jgi:hypothetical protein